MDLQHSPREEPAHRWKVGKRKGEVKGEGKTGKEGKREEKERTVKMGCSGSNTNRGRE